MRPLQLELEGFMSFRQRTVIDFTDADLFVLVGAMGAGKSSIIDAMGFALYGSIARFENLNLVSPVISQGLNEARVRLDFRLGGREFSAVRVVRRNKSGGAGAAEARLSEGELLHAGDPAEVTKWVTETLGLTFEQFTKCVVLPQGEFAELLHARPAERQDLLVRLLDIGMYSRLGARAGRRRDRARDTTELLQKRLDEELAAATEEAYAEQEQWVQTFQALYERFQAEQETLDALQKDAEANRVAAENVEGELKRLAAIAIPAGIGDLGERLRRAEAAHEEARESARAAVAELARLQEEREPLGEKSAVEATIALYDQAEGLRTVVAAGEQAVEKARANVESAAEHLEKATTAHDTAVAQHDELERAHSAYHAARGLKKGDVCPVCGEVLTAAPAVNEPPGLAQAKRAAELAAKELRAREGQQKTAADAVNRAELALAGDEKNLASVEERLAGRPGLDECRQLLGRIESSDRALVVARTQERETRAAAEQAEADLEAARKDESEALANFNAARDPVAALGAPAAAGGIEESWRALCTWAQEQAEARQESLRAAREAERAAREQADEMVEAQRWACESAELQVGERRPAEAVYLAMERAKDALASIDSQLATRKTVERDLEEGTERARVAGLLWTHLKADHFERWYLREAMTRLVKGATERLQELSNDQYALALNKNGTDFVVVDKINANEERPVRTLSGGETFLASLALALALGEEVASLAVQGSARLDALFLDEGFGSLDPTTLETVSSTIEELGAGGRMVGIVTHVPELAGRIPVQFHVSKEAGSSRIERVAV